MSEKMIPSMWSSYFVDLSPVAMVECFAENEWTLLELSDEHGQALLDHGSPATAGRAIRHFAMQRGVRFIQGHLPLKADIAGDDGEETIAVLKKWLDLFYSVGVREAVLHPGGAGPIRAGASKEELLERRANSLRALVEHIQGENIYICLENAPGEANTIEELLEIIKAVGSRHLGVCLDTGHLNLDGGDPADFIRKAGEHLRALHVNDNDGSSDQHLLPFGGGSISWPEITRALREIDYGGPFNYEIPGETRCPYSIRLEKLKYIRRISGFLTGETPLE